MFLKKLIYFYIKKKRSIGALIVYDVTRKESFLNIQKWIAETNNYANDKMVKILVGNKNDLSHKYKTNIFF